MVFLFTSKFILLNIILNIRLNKIVRKFKGTRLNGILVTEITKYSKTALRFEVLTVVENIHCES